MACKSNEPTLLPCERPSLCFQPSRAELLRGSIIYVLCLVNCDDYDTYANSGPRHAIQKSLTAALVALAPLRLRQYISVRLGESEVEMLT